MYRRRVKRILDTAAVVVLAPFALVLCAAVAATVRLAIGSPVLFRQRRAGLYEKLFWVLKFRTMLPETDANGRRVREHDRMPRIGAFLRKSSLDELPQLWNVLRGEMSLIGPRPLLEEYLPYYTQEERKRHLVRPGMTGWAQVNGRNTLAADQRLAMDVWYVEHLSWKVDARIACKTVAAVLSAKDIHISPADVGIGFVEARAASCLPSAMRRREGVVGSARFVEEGDRHDERLGCR